MAPRTSAQWIKWRKQHLEPKQLASRLRHGRYIFVYNNVKTNQVIYSLKQELNQRSIRQLSYFGKKTVPASIRPDMWRPLLTISFPPGQRKMGLLVFQRLREHRKVRDVSWREREDLKVHDAFSKTELPKTEDGEVQPIWKARQKILMDQKAEAVADVAAVLAKYNELAAEQAEQKAREDEVQKEKLQKLADSNKMEKLDSHIRNLIKALEKGRSKKHTPENPKQFKRSIMDQINILSKERKRIHFAKDFVKSGDRPKQEAQQTEAVDEDTSLAAAEETAEIAKKQDRIRALESSIRNMKAAFDRGRGKKNVPEDQEKFKADIQMQIQHMEARKQALQQNLNPEATTILPAAEAGRKNYHRDSDLIGQRIDVKIRRLTRALEQGQNKEGKPVNEDGITVALERLQAEKAALERSTEQYVIMRLDLGIKRLIQKLGKGKNAKGRPLNTQKLKAVVTHLEAKKARLENGEALSAVQPESRHDGAEHEPEPDQVYSLDGVRIHWRDLQDAEFAASWPEKVEHDTMGKLNWNIAPDPTKEKEPLFEEILTQEERKALGLSEEDEREMEENVRLDGEANEEDSEDTEKVEKQDEDEREEKERQEGEEKKEAEKSKGILGWLTGRGSSSQDSTKA